MRVANFKKYVGMAFSVAVTSFGGGYLFYLGTPLAISGGIILLTVYVLLQAHYFKIMDTREHIKATLDVLTQYRGEAIEIKQSVDMMPDFIRSEQNKFVEYLNGQIAEALKAITS